MEVTVFLNGKREVATKRVEVVRRKLQLQPPSAFVKTTGKIRSTAVSDTAGSLPKNVRWFVEDADSVGLFAWSQCTSIPSSGTSCEDGGPKWDYTRVVEAVLDDSLQRAAVPVIVYTKFEVRADKQQLHVGETVTFTGYLDGEVTAVDQWRWGSATANDLNCVNTSSCTKVAVAVGTHAMTGTLRDGSSASASVTVIDTCPPGHQLLDRWEIRQGLVDNLKLSKTQNREIPFVVIYDSATAGYTVQSFTGMMSWECLSGVPDAKGIVNEQLSSTQYVAAWGHPHLYPPHHSYTCSAPKMPSTVKSPPGAGVKDWSAQKVFSDSLGYQVPAIIVDPWNAYILNPGGKKGDETRKQPSGSKPKTMFDRKVCGWPI